VQVLQDAQKIGERPAKAINRPRGDHVELSGVDGLQHRIKARTLVAALRTADASVLEHAHHVPSRALGYGLQLAALVVGVLLRRADPEIDCNPLH
jgi:hypothetical protein